MKKKEDTHGGQLHAEVGGSSRAEARYISSTHTHPVQHMHKGCINLHYISLEAADFSHDHTWVCVRAQYRVRACVQKSFSFFAQGEGARPQNVDLSAELDTPPSDTRTQCALESSSESYSKFSGCCHCLLRWVHVLVWQSWRDSETEDVSVPILRAQDSKVPNSAWEAFESWSLRPLRFVCFSFVDSSVTFPGVSQPQPHFRRPWKIRLASKNLQKKSYAKLFFFGTAVNLLRVSANLPVV